MFGGEFRTALAVLHLHALRSAALKRQTFTQPAEMQPYKVEHGIFNQSLGWRCAASGSGN